jgi:hypothetical protein
VVCERDPSGIQTHDELDGYAPQADAVHEWKQGRTLGQGLLEQYAIDFEERHTSDPFVTLHWNGTTYTDLFGIADFLMFAGRLPLPGMRAQDRTEDGELPGSRIPLL